MAIRSYSIDAYRPRKRDHANRTSDRIISYDIDNAYPQRTLETLLGSSTGASCVAKLAKFLKGRGFEDEQYRDQVINRHGQTIADLQKMVSVDYARHNYFCLHVNYNLNYSISEVTRIDPTYCRYSEADTSEYIPFIAVYNDWAKDNFKIIKRSKVDYLDVFNPSERAVASQIEREGGIENYKGQILFFTGQGQSYPLAVFDSVLDDLATEALISRHNKRMLDRGFMAKQLLTIPELGSDEERDSLRTAVKAMQGAESNDIMILETPVNSDTKDIDLKPINHTYSDKQFVNLEESTRGKIIRAFDQPGILHSDYRSGSLGGSTEIEDAFHLYNISTSDMRADIETAFKKVFMNFWRDVNPSDNWGVLPFVFREAGTEEVKENG